MTAVEEDEAPLFPEATTVEEERAHETRHDNSPNAETQTLNP